MSDHPQAPAAQELTPQEVEERAARIYAVDQRIKASLQQGRAALWNLAEALYEFDEESGWTALGYESLKEYLAEGEIGMSRSSYFGAVGRWRKLVVMRQVQSNRLNQLDPSKVDIVLPSIEAATVQLSDALDDVESMGKRDLREKYLGKKELPRGRPDDDIRAEAAEATAAAHTTVLNDGTDTPEWAGRKDDRKDDSDTSTFNEETGEFVGPVPDDDDDVVEGTATDVVEPAQNARTVSSGQLPGLEDALREAQLCLREEYPLRSASRSRYQAALMQLARVIDREQHYHAGEPGTFEADCPACQDVLKVKPVDPDGA